MKLWDKARRRKWKIEWLMFEADTVLVGDSEKELQALIDGSKNVFRR